MNIIKALIYGNQKPDPAHLAGSMFRGVSSAEVLSRLMRGSDPGGQLATKMHVTAALTAHLLFIRVVGDNYQNYANPFQYSILFNAMSDEFKRLFKELKLPMISPMIAFQDLSRRVQLVPILCQESELFSLEPSIGADSLFGMMLMTYVKRFIEMFPINGVNKVTITPFTIQQISNLLGSFMVNVVFEDEEQAKEATYDSFVMLGAWICGSVNSAIKSSPIR
jgi:hypothetical protein